MNIKFNIKGVIYSILVVILVIGGFIVIPNVFMDKSKPVDYTMVQREAIPQKILDMMDKYTDQERALSVKLDKKIYVIVTRDENVKSGIEMDKINISQEEGKNVMSVNVSYKEKEKSYPYIVVETNLTELPDRIELNAIKEESIKK